MYILTLENKDSHSVNTDFIIDSFNQREVLHQSLKQADDSIRLSVPFSADIWNGGNTDEDNAYLNAALSQSASNITGSSASYTAARDIYVTINYDHSYVNGDAREIALSLYNELKDCKKLNLIA